MLDSNSALLSGELRSMSEKMNSCHCPSLRLLLFTKPHADKHIVRSADLLLALELRKSGEKKKSVVLVLGRDVTIFSVIKKLF